MPVNCCVPNCYNRRDYKCKGVSWTALPQDGEKRTELIERFKLDTCKLKKKNYICSAHLPGKEKRVAQVGVQTVVEPPKKFVDVGCQTEPHEQRKTAVADNACQTNWNNAAIAIQCNLLKCKFPPKTRPTPKRRKKRVKIIENYDRNSEGSSAINIQHDLDSFYVPCPETDDRTVIMDADWATKRNRTSLSYAEAARESNETFPPPFSDAHKNISKDDVVKNQMSIFARIENANDDESQDIPQIDPMAAVTCRYSSDTSTGTQECWTD